MDFIALFSESGWEVVAEPSTTETGTIDLRTKTIGGVPCLRGAATVDASIDALYGVVTDVPAAPKFSSETLIASRVLGRHDGVVDYYQHLDVPNWTLASDRFWVVRGKDISDANVRGFTWERFDWKSAYPELVTELSTDHPSSVEPDPNFGGWTFRAAGGKTDARYHICTNAGGSLPQWLQKAAATKTLPGTMADVVREAMRREGR